MGCFIMSFGSKLKEIGSKLKDIALGPGLENIIIDGYRERELEKDSYIQEKIKNGSITFTKIEKDGKEFYKVEIKGAYETFAKYGRLLPYVPIGVAVATGVASELANVYLGNPPHNLYEFLRNLISVTYETLITKKGISSINGEEVNTGDATVPYEVISYISGKFELALAGASAVASGIYCKIKAGLNNLYNQIKRKRNPEESEALTVSIN